MIKLDVARWLERSSQVHKGAETIHDFCRTSAAESCERGGGGGGGDGCEAAEASIKHVHPVPTKAGSQKQNFSTFHPDVHHMFLLVCHSYF